MGDYKKFFSLLLSSFIIFLAMTITFPVEKAAAQASGNWASYTAAVTENNGVYEISSAEQLAWIASVVNSNDSNAAMAGKTIKLMNDIDLSAHFWKPIASQSASIYSDYKFQGTFDGNGKTISNLTIGTAEAPFSSYIYYGLFGKVTEGAVIKDLDLNNVSIYATLSSTTYYCGAMAGYISGSSSSPVTITDCSVDATISASGSYAQAGGLAGNTTRTKVYTSFSEVTISGGTDTGSKYFGGLIAYPSDSQIYNCYASGNISAGQSAGMGGLAGYSAKSEFYNSYALTNISLSAAPSKYSTATLGGLTGTIQGGEVANCYASANIAGLSGGGATLMGGITGCSFSGSSAAVWNGAYWDNSATQTLNGIDITEKTGDGTGVSNSNLTGLSASEMQREDFLSTLNNGNDNITDAVDWKFMAGRNDGFPMLTGVNDKIECTVTFDSQGGTEVNSQTVNEGSTVTEPQAPTKEYCEFADWYTDDTYATAWDFANDKVTQNLTLYARWVVEKHTVRFDSRGGTAVLVQSVEAGSTIDRPDDPEKDGYELTGWFEDEEFSNAWDFDNDMVSTEMVLYAGWVKGSGVSISGRITDQDTGLGINGASVSLVFQENGQVAKVVKTNDFGYYRLDFVKPGTYTLEAAHPAYYSGMETGFEITEENRSWDKQLVPDETVEPTLNIYAQIVCVTSGMQLEDVPVHITVVKSFDQTTAEYSNFTDYYGVVHFPGMPKGFYTFSINQGEDKRGGWEGYSTSVSEEITADQWVDCKLKPEYRELAVSVYGYDPVKDLPNQLLGGVIVEAAGMDPRDSETELIPAQTGVTGTKKDGANWDNSMAGKVNFKKLIPIDWRIDTKRMGYVPEDYYVYSDAAGNLTETGIRIDIDLEPTKLRVNLNSPYNDPEMLEGLEVVLTGLESSNTDGIMRTVKAVYDEVEDTAYALFENILPGDYRILVNDTVNKAVSILINGQELYDSSNYATQPKNFDVNFNGQGEAYAGEGETTEIAIDLQPDKMKLKGTLYAVDEQNTDVEEYEEYLHYAVSSKEVEIHASEYYQEHMPDGNQVITVVTNESGEFEAELYPGLYGVVVNNMDDYWGNSVEFSNGNYTGWPYYQIWPYSYASARAYMSRGQSYGYDPMADLGGMAMSSGEELNASFFTRKNWFNASFTCDRGAKDPTSEQVTSIDSSNSDSPIKTIDYDDLRNKDDGAVLALNGSVSRNVDLATQEPDFTELLPGNYTVGITHDRYSADPLSFSCFDFPSPGSLPATAFPEDYNDNGNPWPMLPWTPDALICEMQGANKVKDAIHVNVYTFNPETGWELYEQNVYPCFIRTGYTGTRTFAINSDNDYAYAYVPNSSYDAYFYWGPGDGPFSETREHWYKLASNADGSLSGSINIGSTPETPLTIEYTLEVVALDTDNRTGDPLPNVAVTLDDQGDTLSSGNIYQNQTRKLKVTAATLEPWKWVGENGGFETEIDYSSDTPYVKLTIYMEKSVNIRGEVLNSVTGDPVEGAQWKMLKAFGNEVVLKGEANATSAFGEFSQSWPLENRVYFLEFEAAGYEPCRVRLNPADAQDDPYSSEQGLLAHVLTGANAVKMNPVSKPVIADGVEMNRFGGFLTGIKKAGSEATFNNLSNSGTEATLTMNWAINAKLQNTSYTITRPKYDTKDGAAGDEQISINDEIAECWLIDRKAFPNKTYQDEHTDVTVPSTSASSYDPMELHRWLQKIKGGTTEGFKNVYYQYIDKTGIAAAGEDGYQKISGQIHLWELPPDDFCPTFVVVSKLGAVEVYNFDFVNNKDKIADLPADLSDPSLVGIRLPEWFASYVDVMSYGAKASVLLDSDAAKEKVQAVTPMGAILPMPTFTATIETDEMNCLNYDYKLDIEMIQGTKTPAKGMLALGPGSLGFSVFGSMETSLSGAEKKFSMGSSAGMSTDAIDLEKLTPGLLQKLGAKPELNPAPKGEFFHVDDYVFDSQNQPYELGVVDGGSGQLGVKISASGFQLLGPVPNVGWVLLTLQKTGALDAGFLLQGSAGVRGIYSYKTLFPHNLEHETGDGSYVIIVDGDEGNSVTRQLRRSFVGGLEADANTTIQNSPEVQGGMNTKLEKLKSDMGVTDVSSKIVQIGFNLGAGIYVSALGGMTGAEAKIELAGDNGWTDQPSLEITINANGDSPVVKEIKGDVRATTDLYVKAWIAKLQKQYVWGSIPIKHEFSTETDFVIYPISVTIDETNREDYDISTFNGSPQNIVNDFLVIGDYSSDSTGGGTIAYTDMETKGGDMRLMISGYSSEEIWGAPVCISKTGGAIISHDIVKLPGSETYMAVWSEIATEDVDKTCPPSILKYSVGNIVGGEWEWSVPTACVNLDEVATHIELLPNGGQISLVYMSTDEGPQGVSYQVSGLNWNGSSWSTTARLIERSRISGFTSCGTDDPAVSPVLIAYVDDEQNLKTLGWTGNGVSEATLLKEESGNDLALVNDSGGKAYLAYSVLGQGIGLYSYANGQWHNQGTPFTNALPNQLDMQLLSSGELLLGWTDISGDGAVYGIVSQDGMVISNARTLTNANSGKYYGVSLVEAGADDNETAYLFALNESEDVNLNAYFIASNDTRPVLSGTISISGTPNVGETLTVDVSGLTNQEGTLSYQWKRGGTRIEGATAASYVLAEADTGYTITVVVASSYNSGTVTSAATAEISAAGGGLSNLADLSSLILSIGALNPAFSASTLSYTASVANSVNTIRVTASVYDSSATLLINGTELQSGAESGNIELNVGENTITVKVAGTDQTVKTYVITVTRSEEDECFIATAAFGSKFSWPVSLLRQFRDQYLLSNDLGRSFVRFYYHNSPPLADYIAGSEGLRLLVRVLLAPVIGLAYILYHPLWAVLAVGVGLILFKKRGLLKRASK